MANNQSSVHFCDDIEAGPPGAQYYLTDLISLNVVWKLPSRLSSVTCRKVLKEAYFHRNLISPICSICTSKNFTGLAAVKVKVDKDFRRKLRTGDEAGLIDSVIACRVRLTSMTL